MRTPCRVRAGFAWLSSQLMTGKNVSLRFPRRTKRNCAFKPATNRYHMVGGTAYNIKEDSRVKKGINMKILQKKALVRYTRKWHCIVSNNTPDSWGWWEHYRCEGQKEPCNFHPLQRLNRLEIFDEGEEEDQVFFHLPQERNLHRPALDPESQPPACVKQGEIPIWESGNWLQWKKSTVTLKKAIDH